jgi:acetyl esterase/lipase
MSQITRRIFGLSAAVVGVQAAGALPSRARAAEVAVAGAKFDVTPYVHPELRRFIPQMLMQTHFPLTDRTLPMIRKGAAARPAQPQAQPGWSVRMVPGPAYSPQVRVYVINAGAPGAGRPAILHMHGGGFVIGAARDDLRSLQEIASALDCVIVSVDYRLAPETRFPGSLEDNYSGLKWLYTNAEQLGADRSRIAVMGASAGGGHAAMLAIAARDRGEIPLAYQALIFPMLDDRTGSTRQKPPYQGALVWTPEHNRFGWSSLLGVPAGSLRAPYGAVPARIDNLKGLPPAFIGVGSIDLFVDEDIEYARRLIDAGTPVTLDVVPGAFHGFDRLSDAPVVARFRTAMLAAIAQGLKATS